MSKIINFPVRQDNELDVELEKLSERFERTEVIKALIKLLEKAEAESVDISENEG